MKKNIYFILLISFIGLTSCSENEISLNEEFTISTGENIVLLDKGEEINIAFTKVVDYSICPENVVCFWAGKATIQIKVNNDTTYLLGLLDNDNAPTIQHQEYEITLLTVIPTTESDSPTYKAKFILKEIEL